MGKPAAIVVGTSAGGVEALQRLVSALPADFSIPVFVVLHVSPEGSVLPSILNRAGSLRAKHPRDGEKIRAGWIYVAPPDFHMTVHDHRIRIVRGPKENRHRPAIDPLFKSAAEAYGPRAVGVILTGMLDDGTAGLKAIKRRGGTAVVQDPKDALYTGMPRSAIEHVAVDHVVPLAQIPALLLELSEDSPEPSSAEEPPAMHGTEFADFEPSTLRAEPKGEPVSFSCPDCHGTLWSLKEDDLASFRCRTGHSFTTSYLIAGQEDAAEASLWETLRALEEQAALFRHLAEGARERKQGKEAVQQFLTRVEETEKSASTVRELLLKTNRAVGDKPEAE